MSLAPRTLRRLAPALLLMAASATLAAPVDLATLRVLDVGPLTVACDAAPAAPCLAVRAADGGTWTTLVAIDGFEPRPGYGYRVAVVGDATAPALLATLETVPLAGARWSIEAAEGPGVARGDAVPSDAWLRLDPVAGRLAANVGCNGMFGQALAFGPGRLAVGPIGSTLMACADGVMRLERLVGQVLDGVVRFVADGDALRIDGDAGSLWIRPELPAAATATVEAWGREALTRFDARVASATASGASWPFDAIAVALAYAPAWDEANVTITRRDVTPEGADVTVVTLETGGFLDDSLAGLQRALVLLRHDDGRWRVIADAAAQRCARGEALWLPSDALCP